MQFLLFALVGLFDLDQLLLDALANGFLIELTLRRLLWRVIGS